MSLDAGRVGVRADQVDVHGRVTSPSFLNELLEDLPEWTDMPVWVNGTEELLPSNNSVPVTSPILADIAYPDIRRDNQYFTYRESPTTVDGLAKIKSIKGNTLVWNQLQLIPTSSSTTSNGITFTNNNDGSVTANGTATGTAIFYCNSFSLTSGHKYLFKGCPSGGTNNTYMQSIRVNNASTIIGTDVGNGDVYTVNANYTDGTILLRIMSGVTLNNAKFYPQVFDLTQMGLDISSPSEFTSLFPLSYYSYNQGSLLSFMGNGIKTVGFNQFDGQFEQGNISNTGELTPAASNIRSANYNSILPNTKYYLKVSSNVSLTSWFMAEYDVDKNFISRSAISNGEITTKSNSQFFKLMLYYAGGSLTPSNITECCLNIFDSQKNGTYEPYTSSTLSLPISTYFPTGMKSAGNVYDELTPRKAITRIGVVDLGNITWLYNSSRNYFYSYSLQSVLKPVAVNVIPNILSVKYTADNANNIYVGVNDKTIGYNGTQELWVRDANYTDATAFKQAMQGVYLYYELATPVELPTLSLGD